MLHAWKQLACQYRCRPRWFNSKPNHSADAIIHLDARTKHVISPTKLRATVDSVAYSEVLPDARAAAETGGKDGWWTTTPHAHMSADWSRLNLKDRSASRRRFCHVFCLRCVSKKFPPLNCLLLCQILTDFQNFCIAGKTMKFATKHIRQYPPHLTYVTTLPWVIKKSFSCRYLADMEENANKFWYFRCLKYRVFLHTDCK